LPVARRQAACHGAGTGLWRFYLLLGMWFNGLPVDVSTPIVGGLADAGNTKKQSI